MPLFSPSSDPPCPFSIPHQWVGNIHEIYSFFANLRILGRVMSRFSKDQDTLDNDLAVTAYQVYLSVLPIHLVSLTPSLPSCYQASGTSKLQILKYCIKKLRGCNQVPLLAQSRLSSTLSPTSASCSSPSPFCTSRLRFSIVEARWRLSDLIL